MSDLTPADMQQVRALARRLPAEDGELIMRLVDHLSRYEGFALLVTSAMANASRDVPATLIVDPGRSVPEGLAALSAIGRPTAPPAGHPHARKR